MPKKKIIRDSFTDEEKELIRHAAVGVWEYVGGDALQALAEEKNKPIERVTYSRSEVIEMALDASRCEERLREKNPDLAKRVSDADYEELIRVVQPAFPHARYGL